MFLGKSPVDVKNCLNYSKCLSVVTSLYMQTCVETPLKFANSEIIAQFLSNKSNFAVLKILRNVCYCHLLVKCIILAKFGSENDISALKEY